MFNVHNAKDANSSGPVCNLIRYLWNSHPWLSVLSIVAGVAAGVTGMAVIDVINSALHSPERRHHLLAAFLALTLGGLFLHACATLLPGLIARHVTIALRNSLCMTILDASARKVDQRSIANLLNLFSNDIPLVSDTLVNISRLFVHLTVCIAGLTYIAYISWLAFFLAIGTIVLGLLMFSLLYRKADSVFQQARDELDVLNEHSYGLLFGLKQLKLNIDRQRWFARAAFGMSSRKFAHLAFAGLFYVHAGDTIGQIAYSALIGFLIFVVPSLHVVDPVALTACVLTILYVMGPLTAIVDMMPRISQGVIAYQRLQQFGALNTGTRTRHYPARFRYDGHWESIELESVVADCRDDDSSNGFELGPLNVRFRPGELVFIVGGNGSGKSTAAKVITALYPAKHGRILLNGRPVTGDGIKPYQNLFSAIFQDFHLFNRIIGPRNSDSIAQAQKYLSLLGLDRHVQIAGASFSTTSALSAGQRKRLALVSAYLEDRPIYVLDEWAADQDPGFKEFFYRVLLPDLRDRGKCVIAVTHDDRYFDVADRIITMETGRVVSDIRAGKIQAPVS